MLRSGCVRVTIEELKRDEELPHTVAGLVQLVDKRFGEHADEQPGATEQQIVELSTVHKAKGLQWDVVYILEPKELPMWFVMEYGQEWEKRQELNVVYVSLTRSTDTLIFLRNVVEKGTKIRECVERLFEKPVEEPPPKARSRRDWSKQEAFKDFRQYHHQRRDASSSQAGEQEPPKMPLDVAARVLGLSAEQAKDRKRVMVAWRKRVLETHPDKNDGVETEDFIAVHEAKKRLVEEATKAADEASDL